MNLYDFEYIFYCRKCNKETFIAPDPPEYAICEDCCEDHKFEYDPWRRGKYCDHCDAEYPPKSYEWGDWL